MSTHSEKNGKKYTVEREKKQFCNFFITFLGETTTFNQKEDVTCLDITVTLHCDMITKETDLGIDFTDDGKESVIREV